MEEHERNEQWNELLQRELTEDKPPPTSYFDLRSKISSKPLVVCVPWSYPGGKAVALKQFTAMLVTHAGNHYCFFSWLIWMPFCSQVPTSHRASWTTFFRRTSSSTKTCPSVSLRGTLLMSLIAVFWSDLMANTGNECWAGFSVPVTFQRFQLQERSETALYFNIHRHIHRR